MKKNHLLPIPSLKLFVLAVFLLWLGVGVLTPAEATPPTAAEVVTQAWQLAQASGSYEYNSEVTQTRYPAPKLSNTGRQPEVNFLALEGYVDQPQNRLEMTLWQDSGRNPGQGIALKVENGQTLARVGTGEWEAVGDVTTLFAPNQDPLGFLGSAKNIVEVGTEQRQVGELTLTFTKYQFELDGPAYARQMQARMEEQLRQHGRLPAGLRFSTAEMYNQATGQGEFWLNSDGLPARLTLILDVPAYRETGRVVADIQTDFSDFDLARISTASTPFWQNPAGWVAFRQDSIADLSQQTALAFSLLLLAVAAGLLVVRVWESKTFHTIVTMSYIFALVVPPLINAEQAQAFAESMRAAVNKEKAQQNEAEEREKAQNYLQSSNWNPQQNPLQSAELKAMARQDKLNREFGDKALYFTPEQLLAVSDVDYTDSDGDGLTDTDEEYWGTCAYLTGTTAYNDDVACSFDTSTAADNVDPHDSDGDGLSDYVEVYDLGILPSSDDTDGDGILDGLEVKGFTDDNNVTWYLDPAEEDSNSDSLLDGAECTVWFDGSPDYDETADCPDTDNDGTPDIFDGDNDGDGVEDDSDLSPNAGSFSQIYTQDTPFSFSATNLEEDQVVLLDLQFRTATSDNLTLYKQVLDWPTNDTQGQITRYLDTTWASTSNSELVSSDANAANGDIRLIPMLEITMPYASGHYANLPITTTAPSTRVLGEEVDTWLDSSQLDPFGIEVADLDVDAGSLVAYVPLSTVTDDYDKTVAFSAQMLYRPSQGTAGVVNWGSAHEFRLIWLVQMLTDECINEEDDPDTCARQDVQTVIHTYYDSWTLSGLAVKESHNLDAAVVYEDPTQDTDLDLDDQLWTVSWNMANTFMRGRDCDIVTSTTCTGDGERDVTISNLADEIEDWFGNDSYIVVDSSSYDHEGYMAYVPSGVGAEILDTVFTPYGNDTIPTLLYAYEYENRSLNLDSYETAFTSSVTFNFDPATVQDELYVTMSWTPYEYVGGAWDSYDSENYLNLLASRLETDDYFLPEDSSQESEDVSNGKLAWVQLYYASLLQGVTALAELDAVSIFIANSDTPLSELDLEPLVPPGTTTGAAYIATAYFMVFAKASLVGIVTKYKTAGWTMSSLAFLEELGSSYYTTATKYSLTFSRQFKWGTVTIKINVLTGLVLAAAIVGATLVAIGYFTGNDTLFRVGIIILNVVTIIVVLVYAINAMLAIRAALYIAAYQGTSLISAAFGAARGFPAAGVLGTVIVIGVAWGFFFAQMGSLSGIALQVALSYAIASTIIAIFFLILDLIGLGIIVMIISLIDAILTLAGETGFTAWLTEVLAEALYDVNMVVTNMSSSDRLDVDFADLQFVNSNGGFTVGNDMIVTYDVTNTLKFKDEFGFSSAAYRTVFRYFLENSEEEHHEDLELGDMSGEWADIGDDKMQTADNLDLTINLGGIGTGVNRQLPAYLTEAYLISYKGCWFYDGWFGADGCSWEAYRASTHIDVGQYLVYDILPNGISQFARMDWNGGSPAFPEQVDSDNDSLPDTAGTDPNDGEVDTDLDGLPDVYELTYGLDPEAGDGDGDGLNDAEELTYDTNPFVKDSDGDGLNDYIEVKTGWLIVYNGSQLTRVWSDPNVDDADEDGLTDLDEFLFGFNPWVTTDPSIIDTLVDFDNLRVDEDSDLQLLLQFEETSSAQNFVDSSGQENGASCADSSSCPTAEVSGRYGTAASFAGTDYVDTSASVTSLAKADFTISAWVKTTATSVGIVTKNDGDNTWESGEKSFYLGSTGIPLFVGFGNNYIRGNTAVNDGQWHHLAVVWDYSGSGTAGTGKIYIDGVDRTGTVNYAANNADGSTHTLKIGAKNSNAGEAPNHFNGSLDEVAVLDVALSLAEVQDLYYGRYNPNDLLLQPDSTLIYQTTITNSSSTEATGYLIAETEYLDPEIGQPYIALSFEDQQRLAYFTNSLDEENSIYCVDDGHCPTAGIDGYHSNAVEFDGVDDYAILPTLSNGNSSAKHFSFFIRVDSLPTSGTYDTIIDTDSTTTGSTDIYLNSSGNLVFDISGYTLLTSSYSFSGNLGTWVHVAYNGYKIYINTGSNTSDDEYPTGLRVGSGRLGNNMAGTQPFDGAIDAMVYYDTNLEDGSGGGTSYNEIASVRDGSYYLNFGGSNGAARIPKALFKFDELVDYDGTIHYDSQTNSNHATCSNPTCPTLATGGYSGRAVTFDGVDDYLTQPGSYSTDGNGETSVTFYIKLTQYPTANAYVFDTTSGTDVLDMYITSAGKVVATRQEGTHTSTGSIPLNQWVKVYLEYDKYHDGSNWRYDSRLYFNDVYDSTRGYLSSSSTASWNVNLTIGSGRIGNNTAGTNPLNGSLDNLNIQVATLEFDPPVTNLGYENLANDIRSASCEDVFVCPTVVTGQFDDAAGFDGDSYLTVKRGSNFFNNGQFTQAAWIYPSHNDSAFHGIWGYQNGGTNYRAPSLWVFQQTKLHGGFGTGSLWNSFTTDAVLTNNAWNHVVSTFDGTTYTLYVNGAVVYTNTSWAGQIPYQTTQLDIGRVDNYFVGTIDELVMLPTPVDSAAVQLLMNSTYPLIDVDTLFQSFTTPAVTTQQVSGTAAVSPYATSSKHSFDQEVEVALELQAQIDYPVIDDNSAYLAFFLPFEDTPGSTNFANLIGFNGNYYYGECTEPACPAAGLRGQIDRAAYFDGVDDHLYINTAVDRDFRTLSVWVNAKQGTVMSVKDSPKLQIDMNRLYATYYSSGAQHEQTMSLDLPRDEWFHLAVTIDSSYVARIYINGVEETTTGTIRYVNSIEELYIGANSQGQDFLEGYLDDFRVYEKTLSAAEVLTLYEESAPVVRFEFDEDSSSTTYVDNSVNQFVGTPTTSTYFDSTLNETVTTYNPLPGTDGKIGNTALFDGDGSISVADAAAEVNFIAEFTAMAWVKTTGTKLGILVKTDGDNSWEQGEKAFYVDSAGKPAFVGFGNNYIKGSEVINDDVWHHVVVTWNPTTSTGRMYVDGTDVTSQDNYAPNNADRAADTLRIGASNKNSNEAANNFVGQIDELGIYVRELTAAEIFSIYLREYRWYRATAYNTVQVDTTPPTVELLSNNNAYWQNGYIQLAVATQDTHSRVTLLDFGLKGPSDSSFSWQGADVCTEAAETNAAWCPSFTSDEEGIYEVQFRAVDAAGNETTSSTYTLYVDGQAPAVPTTYSNTWLSATQVDDLSWTVTLNSTISEPTIETGIAGSGLAPTIQVALFDSRDALAEDGWQETAVSGNTWSLAYELNGQKPSGRYTVKVQTTDLVGNSSTISIGTIRLDTRPPQAQNNDWESPSQTTFNLAGQAVQALNDTPILSDTADFSGVVVEQPHWGSYAAEFHFEEGSTTFYDSSDNLNHASCSVANCPTLTSGLFGQAADFDGSNDIITLPSSTSLNIGPNLTLAAWVNPDTITGGTDRFITVAPEKAVLRIQSQQLHFYIKLDNVLHHVNVSNVLTAGAWQHVAATYDGQTMRVYHNGEEVGSKEVTGTMPTTTNAFLSSSSESFDGLMDEVLIIGRTLTDEEIYSLAQANFRGVQTVEYALATHDFSGTNPPTLSWQPAMVNQNSWNFTLSGDRQGFYDLNLRSTDSGNNSSTPGVIWRGMIDTVPPVVVASGQHIGGGSAAETEYTFTFTDFVLDSQTFVHPCGTAVTSLTYSDETMPHNGYPYQVSGTCRVSGHETSRAFTTCDAAGHCTSQNVTPSASTSGNIILVNPAEGSSWLVGSDITISGGGFAPNIIQTIQILVNGEPLTSLPYGGTTTNANWSTLWHPTSSGSYTIQAILTAVGGQIYSDSVQVTVTGNMLNVSKLGNGSGTVTSDPSGISCGVDCEEGYAENTAVTLTAVAATGSTFTGWSGDCSGTAACVVMMSQIRNVTASFVLNQYALTVTKDGNGSGSVSSSPAGITCGADCAESYNYGTAVTLTPTPDTGSTFTGWSGACTGTGACVVTIDQAKAVNATFTLNQYALTVTKDGNGSGVVSSSPAGINCGADCAESYNHNTQITLTAAPATGSTFTGWSGACTGTAACVVTLTQAQNVTATFTLNQYALNVTKDGNGSGLVSSDPAGIDCGADCSEVINYGTVITLTATADTGSIFTGWSGACTGAGECVVTVANITNVNATFTLGTHALTVLTAGNGSGLVTSDPAGINCGADCVEIANFGTVFTLTAAPEPGSIFMGWSGVCSGTAACVVTVESTEEVTATFTLEQHTLTVEKAGNGAGLVESTPAGINCGSDCAESYNFGTTVVLTATASTGSTFTGWSGGCSGTGTCELTITQAENVTATFVLNSYELTVETTGNGSGVVESDPAGINCGSDCAESYLFGTLVTLNATPDTGSIFMGWSGACTGAGDCVVTVEQAETVTATFTLGTHALTVLTAGNGSGLVTSDPAGINCGDDCVEIANFGTVFTLTAAPETGSIFAGWSGACSGTAACVVTIEGTEEVTATFTLEQHTLTVEKAGNGAGLVESTPAGINCGSDCAENYDFGTVVTLTATPDTGSTFTGWAGACTGAGACVVTVEQAQTVTATFTLGTNALTVLKDGTGAGLVESDPAGINCGADCVEIYDFGTLVTLTATPDSGSTFIGWSGACTGTAACVVTVDQAQEVTATFEEDVVITGYTIFLPVLLR